MPGGQSRQQTQLTPREVPWQARLTRSARGAGERPACFHGDAPSPGPNAVHAPRLQEAGAGWKLCAGSLLCQPSPLSSRLEQAEGGVCPSDSPFVSAAAGGGPARTGWAFSPRSGRRRREARLGSTAGPIQGAGEAVPCLELCALGLGRRLRSPGRHRERPVPSLPWCSQLAVQLAPKPRGVAQARPCTSPISTDPPCPRGHDPHTEMPHTPIALPCPGTRPTGSALAPQPSARSSGQTPRQPPLTTRRRCCSGCRGCCSRATAATRCCGCARPAATRSRSSTHTSCCWPCRATCSTGSCTTAPTSRWTSPPTAPPSSTSSSGPGLAGGSRGCSEP